MYLPSPSLRGRGLASCLLAGAVLAATSSYSVAAPSGAPLIRKTYAESRPGVAPTLPVAKGAPNVIWILLDDVGYGASSTFGGGARTPVLGEQRRRR